MGAPVSGPFLGSWPARLTAQSTWLAIAVGTGGDKVDRVSPANDGNGNFGVGLLRVIAMAGRNALPDDRYLTLAYGYCWGGSFGFEIWRQLNSYTPPIADTDPGIEKGGKDRLPDV